MGTFTLFQIDKKIYINNKIYIILGVISFIAYLI